MLDVAAPAKVGARPGGVADGLRAATVAGGRGLAWSSEVGNLRRASPASEGSHSAGELAGALSVRACGEQGMPMAHHGSAGIGAGGSTLSHRGNVADDAGFVGGRTVRACRRECF